MFDQVEKVSIARLTSGFLSIYFFTAGYFQRAGTNNRLVRLTEYAEEGGLRNVAGVELGTLRKRFFPTQYGHRKLE